jgi:hypothetical protein
MSILVVLVMFQDFSNDKNFLGTPTSQTHITSCINSSNEKAILGGGAHGQDRPKRPIRYSLKRGDAVR